MTTKVTYDFSRPASLIHIVTDSGAFDAVSERGRASATIGMASGATRVAAGALGAWANGLEYTVLPPSNVAFTRVDLDPARAIRVLPKAGALASDVRTALNSVARADPRLVLTPRDQAQLSSLVWSGYRFSYGADFNGGDGMGAVSEGTVILADGADPTYGNNEVLFSSDANGGLFVFDSDEPLVLLQFQASLGASVAWALTLRELTPARGDQSIAIPVTNNTSSGVLVNTPVVIPPGWGLGFSANTTGRARAIVRRMYS
jgi:hypothetical protein